MFLFVIFSFILLKQSEVWSLPLPQQIPANTLSNNTSLPSLSAQQLLQAQIKNTPQSQALGGSSVSGVPSPNANSYSNPGSASSLGFTNLQNQIPQQFYQRPQQNGYGYPAPGQGNSNNPIQFSGGLMSSAVNLGKNAFLAKTQTASELMDGVSYGLSRVPSFVGYGVEGFGRLEKAGEHLFKAALDLGTGGLTNGMEGLATGMNIVNGLSTAGVKGLTTLASGGAKLAAHIISLGQTESGLFNTLIALSRLMSPSVLQNFQASGISMDSLVGAAKYLGIPMTNVNLNTLLSAAQRLQNSGVTVDSVRQAATSAVNNLGLSTAWNALTSRLNGNGGNVMDAINAAAQSNTPLPVPPRVGIPPDSMSQAVQPTAGGWLSLFGR